MQISGIMTSSYSRYLQVAATSRAKDPSVTATELRQRNMELWLQVLLGGKREVTDQAETFMAADFTTANMADHPAMVKTMDPAEAAKLVAPDGFYGIDQTAARLSDFVVNGAGDDLQRLRAGREGILRGFREAEEAWGGRLPEISYDTLKAALDTIDDRIRQLGGGVIEVAA